MNRLIRTSRNFNCTLYRVIARGILAYTTKTIAKTEVTHRVLAVVLAIFVPVFGYIYLYTPTLAPIAKATPNNTINFQARLLTNTGALIPDGNYHIEFKIYDSASAGSSAQGVCSGDSSTDDCWWRETRTTGNLVTVKNGYITANLGSVTSFPSNMPWDQELWLAMNIGGNGGSATWDGEMSPRMKITAVPYAMRSAEATQLKVNNGAITSTLSLQSPTVGNQVFQIQDQGAAGTYNLCVQNSTACGFAPSATNGYVQLAPASAQTDATTNSSIYINKTGASGNLLQLQKNGTDIFTINNAGGLLLQGTGTNSYTSPGGNTVLSQRFGIASSVLGATETQIRLGIASGSNAGSTAITAFDGRTSTDNNPTISVISPAETGVIGLGWDGQDARGYLKVSNSGFAIRQGTNNIIYSDNINGSIAFRPYGANNAQSFAILNSAGDIKFSFNAQTDTIGMDTDIQFNGPQTIKTDWGNLTISANAGVDKIILQGAIDITGTSTSVFTTPQGSNVNTKINIPLYNPGVFSQVLAFGLPNTASSSSRGISIFDNRTAGDNQPVLSVFTPDETQVFGLNTDGSNTTGYLKSSGIDLGVKIGTTTNTIFKSTGELNIIGTLDTISANSLSIGTTNATQINLDKNTVVANNQSFTANGASLFKNATASATAFQIQDTGSASLLTANTLTRTGGQAGNVLKVGNSTGTDTDTTLLVLDSATANPTTNLTSLNGALFYNSTNNKVSAVENGAVVEVCTTGTVCTGYAPSATNGYVQLAPASAQTDATTNSSIFINKTGGSGNILQLQKNGTDVFRISNTGSVLLKNSSDSTTGFQIQPSSSATPVLNVDTVNSRVGIGTSSPNARLEINGNLQTTALSTSGVGVRVTGATYTDTGTPASGTVVRGVANSFGIPTFAASNSNVTYTDAATLYIAGPPTAGSNVTITNPYAIYVSSGNSVFGGNISTSGGYTATSGSGITVTSSTTASALSIQSTLPTASSSSSLVRIGSVLNSGNASGTFIGINSASGFSGDFVNLQVNGVSAYSVNNQGSTVQNGTFVQRNNSATAFQIQDTGSASLLTANTLTRTGGQAGNVLKVGNSTGTDTDTTLLVLDSATANPTTNLTSLNGALFYNSTNNKVSAVENGAVVEVCTTGTVCTGYAPSATNGYVQLAPASAQTDATTNSSIFINKTGGSGNILQLQNNGSDVFRIGNSGNATFFRNITLTGTTTANYNFQVGATVQSTDTTSQYSLQNQTSFDVTGLAGTLANLYGHLNAQTITNGTGKTITNVYGLSARAPVNNGATITTRYAIQADASTGNTGTITNNYGLYVNDLSGVTATNNFPIYVKASGNYALFSVNSTGATIFRNSTDSNTAFQVQASGSTNPILNVDTSNSRLGINTSTQSYDLSFGQIAGATTARTIGVEAQGTVATSGNGLTVTAGTGNTTGAGGTLTLQGGTGGATSGVGGAVVLRGGTAGGGNTAGGDITVSGGTGAGTGLLGVVKISNPIYNTATETTCAVDCNITQANVSNNGAVIVNASTNGLNITLVDPTVTTAGRVVYITASNGSQDFTLRANVGGGTGLEQNIAMRQNTTATMIWNGNDWTAAGASSSTTLQAAYDNTLSSAGGAEIVLNNTATSNGLTVRNNATSPIIGGIFETQTSIGSNLFSVNNNATEFATNGGAETQGASASTFPSNTWDQTTGGTVDRWTTTGDNIATGAASVRVQASAINHGARNRLSATLTSGLTYSVSFAVRGATNFSTLDVRYSPDGTTTGTTQCSTAEVVTSGIWTRINCTFVASGTITASNSILIRQTDGITRTFYIDNLSVNINASATYASDGSVDNAGAFGTNWTAFDGDGGGAGTATAVRDSTVLYDSSASARVDTSNHANMGIRNNLSIAPAVNTQYLVSFYARSATGAVNDLTVRYSRNGGTNFVSCVDYSTQVINTTGWTKISCLFTTDGTTPTNADIVITQNTAPGGIRSIYIDALSITLNTNNANNVQIGGANKGGPTTLFTLDRSDSAPIAANNDAYLGSMYYDTTTGRIQCYEADGWGACGSAPDNIVNLNPEYAGAVLNGTGVGTMTADLCADQAGVLEINTALCDGTGSPAVKATNFYRWTSPQASQQTYSIYVSYQLPTTFKGFASDDTVQLTARVDSTTNASVTYEMFKSESGTLTRCGTAETAVTTNANEWQTVGINGNEATGCGFNSSSGGAYVIFKINVKANSNANAYVSTLSFVTTGK